MNEDLEVGDLVFVMNRNRVSHYGRGVVVGVSKKRIMVKPIPRHRKIESFKRNQIKLWKSKKESKDASDHNHRGTDEDDPQIRS